MSTTDMVSDTADISAKYDFSIQGQQLIIHVFNKINSLF
jgi:hypothetical protein